MDWGLSWIIHGIAWFYAMAVVLVGWVVFRAANIEKAIDFLSRM